MNGEVTMSGNSEAQTTQEVSPDAVIAVAEISETLAKAPMDFPPVAESVVHVAEHVTQVVSHVADVVSHDADASPHVPELETHVADVVTGADIVPQVAEVASHASDTVSHVAETVAEVVTHTAHFVPQASNVVAQAPDVATHVAEAVSHVVDAVPNVAEVVAEVVTHAAVAVPQASHVVDAVPHVPEVVTHAAHVVPLASNVVAHAPEVAAHVAEPVPHVVNTVSHVAETVAEAVTHVAVAVPQASHVVAAVPHVPEVVTHVAHAVPQASNVVSHAPDVATHVAEPVPHVVNTVPHVAHVPDVAAAGLIQTVVEAGTAESAPAEEPRKRPVLNPNVEDHQTRAVGSIGAAVETEAEAVAAAAAAQAEAAINLSGPIGQIELPPKQMSLEDGLEQEIEAAMSGQMTAPTAPPVGAATINPSSNAEELPASEEQLESGTKLKAKVQSVTADDVFCEVGYRSPGVLPARQFPQGKQPRVGEEFLVIVEKYDPENSVILVNLPKATRKARGNWEELNVGQITECIVNKTNKGGLEVTVGGLRAFLPASQIDLGFVSSMDALVGQKLTVQITELNPAKRNLVVSRRSVMIAERKEMAGAFWEKVEVGQQFTGTVKTIKDYGVFIDLGGADGFLHIGEMSWTRVKHPSEVLKEGEQCDVVVLSLDREKQKIGLGMRQLSHNPWGSVETTYAVGKEVTGKVTRTTDFGAFVELEPGVEGLIHISEMDHQRIRKVTDVVNIGQEVQAQVLEVAPDRQRISLSLKALKQKPEKPKDEDLAPGKGEVYERKRKEPLRGGKTMGSGGGLFGNPGDFNK